MAVENSLAYYDTVTIMAVKKFLVVAPGVNSTQEKHLSGAQL